jgi:gluconate 2-dehydrogenase gamma chain
MSNEDKGDSRSASGLTALTPSEFRTVEAIGGRIMPTTDTPGAIEAGSAHYIDQALAGPYGPHLDTYRRAIAELDRHSTATLGQPFAGLSAAQQDALLQELEVGQIESVTDGAQFFDLVLRHVMEGFFCEPQYSGNREFIGWKLVGFPGQRYGYDDPYIDQAVDLDPIAFAGPPRKVD